MHAFPLEILSAILALAVIVDLGAECGTGSQKRNNTELFFKGILFLWNFVLVLRQYFGWKRLRSSSLFGEFVFIDHSLRERIGI